MMRALIQQLAALAADIVRPFGPGVQTALSPVRVATSRRGSRRREGVVIRR